MAETKPRAHERRLLRWRIRGKTACGLVGIWLSFAGAELRAQSALGDPVAGEPPARPPAAVSLGLPEADTPGAVPPSAVSAQPSAVKPQQADVPEPNSGGEPRLGPPNSALKLVSKPALQAGGNGDAGKKAIITDVQEPGRYGVLGANREPFPPMIRLDVPGTQVLFRLESEGELRQRMSQEARQRDPGKKLYFPEQDIVLSRESSPAPRTWNRLPEVVEPTAVGFRRLWFHQINFDRYAWDLGFFQPAVSTGLFYFDILTWPVQFMMVPARPFEYNAGWALPGDPVPLSIYPPPK